MTFTHDDIRDRLVDYLYGQLEGEARAAFEAHLASCGTCRDEVSGAERARAVAREVVRRPLTEPVPERVRARTFEAARAALAGKGAPVAKAPARAGVGWFNLLRRRWTFPTFATVAAMAVFLLVRATIFREAQHPVSDERTRELAKPIAPILPPPSAAPEPSTLGDAVVDRDRVSAAAAREAADLRARAKEASSVEGELAGAAAPERRSPVRGKARRHSPPAAGADGAPPSVSGNATLPPTSAAAPKRAAPRDAAKRDLSDFGLDDLATATSAGRPSDLEQDQRTAPQAGERAGAKNAAPMVTQEPLQDRLEERALASEEPAEKLRKKSTTTKSKEPIANAAAPAAAEAAPAPPDPALQLAARAQGFMDAHRWRDAIAAYADLLRRYPQHPLAPEWRRRLATAQAAVAADTGQFATPPP